jgi:cytochrome c biogenesis protein CcdA
MTEVTLLVAVTAGALSLLSPCSALLLPSFFAYAFTSRTALLLRTVAFYGGLLITLVPLGVGASAASSLFYGHRPVLIAVAGWTLIALGVLQLLGRSFALPFAGRIQSAGRPLTQGAGWTSTVALGAVYGLAGFCSGPVLGGILTIAATDPSPLSGGLLLAAYALGMAAPLFLLAAGWDRLRIGERRWVRGRELGVGPLRLHTTSLVAGGLFVLVGVLFLRYDGTAGIVGGLGDTTRLEIDLQTWAASALSGVPGWAVPAAVALVAGVIAWWPRRRRPGGDEDEVRGESGRDAAAAARLRQE